MKRVFFTLCGILSFVVMTAQVIAVDKTNRISHDKLVICGAGNTLDVGAVESLTAQGYEIISLGYTPEGWMVDMAQGSGYTDQKIKISTTWPREWTENCLKSGIYITSIGYGVGGWTVVCSKGTPYREQKIADSKWVDSEKDSGVQKWIKDNWAQGYYISSICFNTSNSRWTFIMSKTSMIKSQSYLYATNWETMDEKIRRLWGEGYNITDISMGPGQILCVMSQYRDGGQYDSQDRAIINPDNFRKQLRDYWNQGYHISRICNGFLK